MGRCRGCSVVSEHPRRWAHSFGDSPGVTCVSLMPWPGRCSPVYAATPRGHRARIPTRFVDVDSTINRVYGYAKQGAHYGYTRVRGLHPLLATVLTPIAAPVIVGTRLRRGSAGSAKGAAGFVAEAITTARAAGVTGIPVVSGKFPTYLPDLR